MNKKAYKTPSTNIIMLSQQLNLLAGSGGVESNRVGYGYANTQPETWE